MRRLLSSLLLLVVLQPAPTLTATWEGTRARIAWQSAGWSCLYRKPAAGGVVLLWCGSGGGEVVIPGPPPQDYSRFPAAGDRYCIETPEQRVCAALLWRVWGPMVGNGEGRRWSVALPLVGR
jgi:hypothetical protein